MSSGVSWSSEGKQADWARFSGVSDLTVLLGRGMQIPPKLPHALALGTRYVCRDQDSARERQVPRLAVLVLGAGEGRRHAWPPLVWAGV